VNAPETFTLQLSPAWWPLGDGSDPIDAVVDVLIGQLAPDLEPAEERGLRASLAVYGEWAGSLAPGERRSFALVRDPATARADALLSWRFGEAPEGAYEHLLASARAQSSTDTVELVNPTVVETRVPLGRAVVVHDIAYARTAGVQRPARERCVVAVFPDGTDALLELTVLTIDLSLFDDLPDYLLRVASGEALPAPGYREVDGGTE